MNINGFLMLVLSMILLFVIYKYYYRGEILSIECPVRTKKQISGKKKVSVDDMSQFSFNSFEDNNQDSQVDSSNADSGGESLGFLDNN